MPKSELPTKKPLWKKILKFFAWSTATLLFVFISFFCIFIANPLESDYQESLLKLIPSDSDAVAYTNTPQLLVKEARKIFPPTQVFNHSGIKKLLADPRLANMVKQFKRLDKELKKQDIDYATVEEYIWKLVGEEVVCSVKMDSDNQPQVLIMTRVTFLVQSAYGAALCFLPETIQQQMSIKLGNKIKSLQLDEVVIGFALHRDVLMVSNSVSYLQQAYNLVDKTGSFFDNRPEAKDWLKQDRAKISLYGNLSTFAPFYQKEPIPFVLGIVADPNSIQDCLANISLDKHVELQFAIRPKDSTQFSAYHQKLYTATPSDFADWLNLPRSTFVVAQMPMAADAFSLYLQQTMPSRMQQQLKRVLEPIQQKYQSQDFLHDFMFQYLNGNIVMNMVPIDFAWHNLNPIDRYPAINLWLPVTSPETFLSKWQNFLEQEVCIPTQNKIQLRPENYAGHDFLRIDLGGFDFTDGSIQPAVAKIGDKICVTSHVASLKLIFDSIDNIEPNLKQNASYARLATLLDSAEIGTVRLFIDADGVIQIAHDMKGQWAKEMAINKINRNPFGKSREQLEQEFLQELETVLGYAKIIKAQVGAQLRHTPEQINGKIVITLNLR